MASIEWPLVDNVIRRNRPSNTFGTYQERNEGGHWGWDFYAASGTPCYAISDGTIDLVYGKKEDTDGFGLVAVLKFEFEGETLYAAYCHLSSVIVPVGKTVARADRIGLTGNSGNASGMRGLDEHLHFEIRKKEARPPRGQRFRYSPLKVFKVCPLYASIHDD